MKKYLEDVAPVLAKVSNYVTRGSDFRLQTRSKYDLRKSLFARRIVTIWNSLPNWNVSDKDLITAPDRTQLNSTQLNTTNTLKNRLDRFWRNQEIIYDFKVQ